MSFAQGAVRPSTDRTSRRWRAVASSLAALFVSAVLVACSSPAATPDPTPPETSTSAAPTPSPTESATTEPTPSPEPSPTESELDPDDPALLLIKPEEMKKDDEEGAIAAAKYTMAVHRYTYLTGDLAPWDALTLDTCGFCESVARNAKELYEAGGFAKGGELTWIGSPKTEYIDVTGIWKITLRAEEAQSTDFDEDGKVLNEYEAGEIRVTAAMLYKRGEWQTSEVRVDGGE